MGFWIGFWTVLFWAALGIFALVAVKVAFGGVSDIRALFQRMDAQPMRGPLADFEHLVGYRELFALLQAIDVNIAAYARIQRVRERSDVVICERGPWDTLVDVTADTGLAWLPASPLGAAYSLLMRRDARVLLISRDRDSILRTRPELVNDHKLAARMAVYAQLAARYGWHVVDNSRTLEDAKVQIRTALGFADGMDRASRSQDAGR